MLFEKMHNSWKARDLEGWKSCHHSDYKFVSHAMGKTMTMDDMSDEMMLGMCGPCHRSGFACQSCDPVNASTWRWIDHQQLFNLGT